MQTLVISSNCSGGGKTTFTLGLMKALKDRGYKVQGFKCGPDYIDPAFHKAVTNNASRNLDTFLMTKEGMKEAFSRGEGDVAIIEGAMGLYDGKGVTTEGSCYEVCEILGDVPIVLVITPQAQSLTLCAEINGLKNFKNANIAGVVLNSVSEKYYNLLKACIEENCNVKVLGYVPKCDDIKLSSRHLGLVQSVEVDNLLDKIEICKELIEKYVNVEEIINSLKNVSISSKRTKLKNRNIKIGIAYDKAFNFYYKENLEMLEEVGEVIYFSPLEHKEIPKDLDFLYIGGGYPEVFKEELSKNISMRNSIKEALENGLHCYAECGGLMYLTEEIEGYPMVGFFQGKSFMTNKLNNFGYCKVKYEDLEITAHEFHKSLVELKENKVNKVFKEDYRKETISWECGYKKKNTLAGYAHIHFIGNVEFLEYLLFT